MIIWTNNIFIYGISMYTARRCMERISFSDAQSLLLWWDKTKQKHNKKWREEKQNKRSRNNGSSGARRSWQAQEIRGGKGRGDERRRGRILVGYIEIRYCRKQRSSSRRLVPIGRVKNERVRASLFINWIGWWNCQGVVVGCCYFIFSLPDSLSRSFFWGLAPVIPAIFCLFYFIFFMEHSRRSIWKTYISQDLTNALNSFICIKRRVFYEPNPFSFPKTAPFLASAIRISIALSLSISPFPYLFLYFISVFWLLMADELVTSLTMQACCPCWSSFEVI